MSLIARELREVRDALRATNGHRVDALTEVRVRELRGIRDLRLPFGYPVSVLAGPNGCGKSTVLFACASAYDVPERGPRDLTPGGLFPDFTSRQPGVSSDAGRRTTIEFHYRHRGEPVSMTWTRGRSWERSFPNGGGRQPERPVYLRTLANLTNPSEVRGVLQLGRKPVETETLPDDLLTFAHRILPWRYRNLTLVSGSASDLLFAEIEGLGETGYSEFHMSSGERSVLRISKDVSRLDNALVLIDEIDTGLHPYTQQQAMLELQRRALRQNLQIVVATHSPVVLDSVPPEARIFLDRDESTGQGSDQPGHRRAGLRIFLDRDESTGQVRRAPPHRDVFQKALYGGAGDRLFILCEDAVAEGVIRGALDVLNVELGLLHGDVVIGRNTGRDEFQNHVRTLAKFHKLSDFVLVLDGDARALEAKLQAVAEQRGHAAQLLFLPGDGPPEPWLWNALRKRPDDYAARLGLSAADFRKSLADVQRLSEGAVRPRGAARVAVTALADRLERTVPEVARIIGRREAERNAMPEFLAGLKTLIERWRRL